MFHWDDFGNQWHRIPSMPTGEQVSGVAPTGHNRHLSGMSIAVALGGHVRMVGQRHVNDAPLCRWHGLQRYGTATGHDAFSYSVGQALKGAGAAFFVPLDIYNN